MILKAWLQALKDDHKIDHS